MSKPVRFFIPFVAGKDRPRFTRSGHTYTTAKTAAHEQEIAWLYRQAGGKLHVSEALEMHVTVTKPLPKSIPKKVTIRAYTQKPDVDNILKLVMDALNGVAHHDDKQIVRSKVEKLPQMRDQTEQMIVTIMPALQSEDIYE